MSLAVTPFKALPRHSIPLLTWGGVRGGVSISLALAVNPAPERSTLIIATHIVAIFTLLVQAPTIGRFAPRQ